MMTKNENRYTSVLWLLLAEAEVSAVVIGVFALIIFVCTDVLFYET